MPKNVSERSDVYSFGVFLLELISGRGANVRNRSNSGENLVLQVRLICKILPTHIVPYNLFFVFHNQISSSEMDVRYSMLKDEMRHGVTFVLLQ